MREEWRECSRVSGYDISSFGRVRSYRHPSALVWTKAGPKFVSKIKTTGIDKRTGYRTVSLASGKSGGKTHLVHLLVLEAFVGKRPSRHHDGSHLNGKRSDSRLSNLKWETKTENQRRRLDHGTLLFGASHPMAKLTAVQVDEIRAMRKAKCTYQEIADRFGVSQSNIHRITSGLNWRRT